MNLALEQAKINLGNTKGNPSVGCVIVKNNYLISAGSTGINGRPHAEFNAIKWSKYKLKNSAMYITLEPCSHYGQTPPCTKIIIKNNIKKVFFSILDPDLISHNKSRSILKKSKILVASGINSKILNEFYSSYKKSRNNILPFVTSKIAISKDFFTIDKKNKFITNKYSRARVHLIRSNHDSIITSSKTILKDNSRLNCRVDGLFDTSPIRIILDKNLKISLNSHIVSDANSDKTIIFYHNEDLKKIKSLRKMKIKLIKTELDSENNLDIFKILIKVKDLGFYRVLLESGIKLTSQFLKKNLIDEFLLFVSNKSLKNRGRNSAKNILNHFLKNKKRNEIKVNLFGEKIIKYRIK
jgi:diaminohydroxyphosphoribosylaminopyrimidine deaminase / 5-amino-6-(5-phosphoribosylamino)uracil reductase